MYKSEYRKFKIKTVEVGKPDDFQSMKEVLSRRLARLDETNYPDLIIIDGGKGQLSSVMQIVEEMGISDINFVSLAKREEEILEGVKTVKPQETPVTEQPTYYQDSKDRV